MRAMENDLLQSIAARKLAIKKRDEKMYALYQCGSDFSTIARAFDMTRENAINRIQRWELAIAKANSTNPFEKVSDRTARLLRDNGMNTPEAVQQAGPQALLRIRNFGTKALLEVQKYFFHSA